MNSIVCSYCKNVVQTWGVGQMTVQTKQHYLNDGALCPGSNEQRTKFATDRSHL